MNALRLSARQETLSTPAQGRSISEQPLTLRAQEDHRMAEIITIGGLELRFLQTKDDTGATLDLFEMTVQPHARMPVPHHHERWEETVYGLKGVMTWRVNGEDTLIGPGKSVFIKRGVIHGFRNDTQKPASCLCIL